MHGSEERRAGDAQRLRSAQCAAALEERDLLRVRAKSYGTRDGAQERVRRDRCATMQRNPRRAQQAERRTRCYGARHHRPSIRLCATDVARRLILMLMVCRRRDHMREKEATVTRERAERRAWRDERKAHCLLCRCHELCDIDVNHEAARAAHAPARLMQDVVIPLFFRCRMLRAAEEVELRARKRRGKVRGKRKRWRE